MNLGFGPESRKPAASSSEREPGTSKSSKCKISTKPPCQFEVSSSRDQIFEITVESVRKLNIMKTYENWKQQNSGDGHPSCKLEPPKRNQTAMDGSTGKPKRLHRSA